MFYFSFQFGDWTPGKKVTFMSNYTKAMTEIYRDTLKNKTLTVVTILGEPYCMEVDDESGNKTGNERFEGYCVDLIKEIAQILEFKYIIKVVEDGVYGKRNERGEWNGMIKELIEGVCVFYFCSFKFENFNLISVFFLLLLLLESGYSCGRFNYYV